MARPSVQRPPASAISSYCFALANWSWFVGSDEPVDSGGHAGETLGPDPQVVSHMTDVGPTDQLSSG
jgi:hypothetical protein